MHTRTWNLYAANGMYYVTTALFTPYIGAYYASCGMGEGQIGILSALIPVSSLLIQPLWAYISDKTGERKRILQTLCLGCAIAILLFWKADGFLTFVIAALLFSFFFSALLPLDDAIVMKLAEKEKVDFSRIRMTGTLCYALVVFVAGYFLRRHFRMMFLMNSVCFLLYFLCCSTLQEEHQKVLLPKVRRVLQKRGKLFRTKKIIVVLLCAFAVQMGLSFNLTYLGVYLMESGYDQTMMGVLNGISALSELPVLLVIRKIYRRYSPVSLLEISAVLCAARLLLASNGEFFLLAAAQLLQGPTYMVCYFTCATYINEQVCEERISQGQSVLALVQSGLGCMCGSLVGGGIARCVGIRNGYRVVAGSVLAIAVGVIWIYRKIQKMEEACNEV